MDSVPPETEMSIFRATDSFGVPGVPGEYLVGASYLAADGVTWCAFGLEPGTSPNTVVVALPGPPPARTISGRVRTSSGASISGVVMNGLPHSPYTGADGSYSDSVPYGWSGTVTPQKSGYRFNPTQRSYTDLTWDVSDQDYVGSPISHTVVALPTGVVQFSVPLLNPDRTDGRFMLREIISDPAAVVAHPGTGEVGWWSPAAQAYTYDTLDGYLNPGYSYFAETSKACWLDVTGSPFLLNVDCSAGWNMIGAPTEGCAWSQVQHPPVDSGPWHWETTSGQYVVASDLQTALGYWIHATAPGALTNGLSSPAGLTTSAAPSVPQSGPPAPGEGPVLMDFDDVPGDYWAYREIGTMRWLGVAGGYSVDPPVFAPGTPVTRDQMAAFLCRAYLIPGVNSPTPSFADVPAEHWAFRYVEALRAAGIVLGYAPTDAGGLPSFRPELSVSRDQMAVFLSRIAKLWLPDMITAPFADVPADYWAAPAIAAVQQAGIAQGYPGSPPSFRPQEVVTRDQMCVFLERALRCSPARSSSPETLSGRVAAF